MKLRQAFTNFIFATNMDGSGQTASYVRALDMLGPILTKHDIVAFPDGSFDLGDIYLHMGDSNLCGDCDCRDWPKFREDAVAMLESFGSKFYIKEDFRRAV